MLNDDPEFFEADISVNDKYVGKGSFEWRTGTLSHRIAETIQDDTVKSFRMGNIKQSSEVTNEALSVISKLKKPATGFEKVEFSFRKLDEKLSETVFDQFLPHAKQLRVFGTTGIGLQETERLNLIELAYRIIEEQEEPIL